MNVLGVDFGTSTTEFALYRDGTCALVEDPMGDEVVPSAVAFLPNGRVVAGRAAKLRCLSDPQNALHSVKRIIGLPWSAGPVGEFRRSYPFALEKSEDGVPVFVTRAGRITAVGVASYLFAYVREFEAIQGLELDGVGVTLPPSFSPYQQKGILEAANRAGFDNVALMDEPYVAALPYLTDEPGERLVVTYDLGGGTFDLAVLRCHGKCHEILAFGGDPYLGGDDVDLLLANWVADDVLRTHHWDLRANKQSFARVLSACEGVKIRLSDLQSTQMWLGPFHPVLAGKDLAIRREQLTDLVATLVQRTFVICDEVLKNAGVKPAEVNMVALVGGTTFMPQVRTAVRHYFGREPEASLPMDRLVAQGAALALSSARRRPV